MKHYRALNALVDLRRVAADIVVLCDLAVYATNEGEKAHALRMLPKRIRVLQFRANRALTALEEER